MSLLPLHVVYLLLNLLIVFSSLALEATGKVVVKSGTGDVQGLVLKSDGGKDFWAFRGIPYAQPPVGHLRFKPPEAAVPWKHMLDATRDAPSCLQIDLMTSFLNPMILGQEDCLYLNVYTPPFQPNETSRAVMVFIHGGGFICGNASYDMIGPNRFMDKDVVLVTMHYRLGVLGFLSTGDSASPGNYGLMDQTLALRWVQQHIKNFGGDPERVTLFGQSAGAAAVSLHMFLPASKGLFYASIQQSSQALSSWMFQRQPLKWAKMFATQANCSSENNQQLVDCLKQKTPEQIIRATSEFVDNNIQLDESAYVFGPVIDGSVLPADPRQMLINKSLPNLVPTMSGISEDEGTFDYFLMLRAFGGPQEQDDSLFVDKIVLLLNKTIDADQGTKLKIVVDKLFSRLNQTKKTDLQTRIKLISKICSSLNDMETDDFNILLTKDGVTVYPYKFNYSGQYSFLQNTDGYALLQEKFGTEVVSNLTLVCHGDEMNYLFHCVYFRSSHLNQQDTRMSHIILNLWTNFAKTRNPTLDGSWKAMQLNHPTYYNINLKPQNINGYLMEYYNETLEPPQQLKPEL